MAVKRARLDPSSNPFSSAVDVVFVGNNVVPRERVDAAKAAGKALRDFLVAKHVAGDLPGCDLAKIAYWHTEACGISLEDCGQTDMSCSFVHLEREISQSFGR